LNVKKLNIENIYNPFRTGHTN